MRRSYSTFKGPAQVDVSPATSTASSGVNAKGVEVVATGSTPFAAGSAGIVGGNATANAGLRQCGRRIGHRVRQARTATCTVT